MYKKTNLCDQQLLLKQYDEEHWILPVKIKINITFKNLFIF
jgi:hypothetical protein